MQFVQLGGEVDVIVVRLEGVDRELARRSCRQGINVAPVMPQFGRNMARPYLDATSGRELA